MVRGFFLRAFSDRRKYVAAMSIWILAVLLIAGLGYVGYAQGAIRVAFSLLGILAGWMLAVPLAYKVAPMFRRMGYDDPVTPLVLGGLLAFVLVSAVFKYVALVVHRKFEVHFKHRAGETQFMLWERLNQRLGVCLGLVNAALYLILIAGLIYGFGYWTIQTARAEGDPLTLRLLNSAARGLRDSGFVRTAAAVAPMGETYYERADFAGLLYNNPSAIERLPEYPAFLSFAERPEFQGLLAALQRSESVAKFMAEPEVRLVMTNQAVFGELLAVLNRDLEDLKDYLKSGKSKKYAEEKVLGHWRFSFNGTLAEARTSKPDITSKDMATLRLAWRARYGQARLIVAPDRQVFVKGLPSPNLDPATGATESRTLKGQWEDTTDGYRMTFEGESGETKATLRDGRLILPQHGMILAFDHER
jgi:hypothetical protein